jgi:transposase
MTKRKSYSKEFKRDAVSLVLEQNYSRAEAAISLEVGINALSRWVKEYQAKDKHAFVGKGKLSPEQAENRKLKARIKRLEMERDILKNATVFFANETK